jgi:hypothetical protein
MNLGKSYLKRADTAEVQGVKTTGELIGGCFSFAGYETDTCSGTRHELRLWQSTAAVRHCRIPV